MLVACVETRLAQGILALTQLWFAPPQLQTPPAAGAAAHAVRRDGTLPGGHAAIY